ncbi:MAG: arginine--tRNA ligase [Endomicrobiales bacterium]|nr:arginine--tRNA ligase [Endomicrobiales bacterium]
MSKKLIKKEFDSIVAEFAAKKGAGAPPAYSLEEPPKGVGGDLAANAALLLAKTLKTNPKTLAAELASYIMERKLAFIGSAEPAGAGFLNFTLSGSFLSGGLASILSERESYGSSRGNKSEKILIEFVSANPTGPLHIGHGRGAAIGDSLARIFSYLGYSVTKEYYINDVGNQMEMLGRSLETRFLEVSGKKSDFPEDGYKGEYIKDIAKKLLEQGRKAECLDFKKTALDEMMSTIKNDLSVFEVKFDNWFSESTLAVNRGKNGRTAVEDALEWLEKEGLAYENEGALWFASTKYGDDKDRVLRRTDGRLTYLASDIAYHKNKIERGFTKLIDLWGADHHGYVPRMKAAVRAIGKDPETLTIVLYQLVSLVRNGVPVTMSTRAGEFVTLEEVVNEVGRDACRFFFNLRAPDSQLEFDLELAKKQSSDNPVFYVQYVHARCNSIFREAASRGIKTEPGKADLSLLAAHEERELVKKLIFFPDTVEFCARTLTPHHLTGYLIETADLYHRFYEKCRVLTDDAKLTAARLALVEAVAVIIREGLGLLGVSAPEKM